MKNRGQLILINGATGAGKTTLCKSIRENVNIPFLHYSLDFFVFDADVLPKRKAPEFGISWSQMRENVIEGFYISIVALLAAGNNLVVDIIVENEEQKNQLLQLLKDEDVFSVGLHCSLPELIFREKARGDREVGLAEVDFKTVHTFIKYHLEIESAEIQQMTAEVIGKWLKRVRSLGIPVI